MIDVSRGTPAGQSSERASRWRGPAAAIVAIACALTTWPWSVSQVAAQTTECTTSWIGPATGFASFGNASFWTTGTPPAATDLVCFPATTAGVVFQRVSATVTGWDVEPGGAVTFQGGTITVTGAADLGGMDLVGSSRFVVGPDSGVGEAEKLRISSGTVDPIVAGLTFSIPESAAVSVDGGSAVFGLDVDNRGTLSSNVVFGSLGLRPGTTLTNSGEILLSGDTTISAEPGTPVARVRNLPGGTIVADGPPFTPLASQGLGDAARLAGVDFQNDGLFHARSGQAVLGSSGVHSGRFVVEAGAQLGLEGASNTFGPGSSVTGGGLVRVAVFLVSSVTTSVVIDGAATFEPAEFHITSGRAVIGGDRTLPVLRFGSGGRLDVNGDARVNGLLAMQPGQTAVLAGSGTLTIPDDAAMTMSGGNALFVRDSLAIVNEGEIRQDGPGIFLEGQTSITNRGRWTITQSGDIGLGFEGRLRNDGLITIDGPADAQISFGERSTFDNPGTIELRSGRIDQRGSRVTQLAGRTLTGGTWSVADGATWIFFPAVDSIASGATVAIGGAGRIDQDAFRRAPTLAALGRVDGTLRLTGGAVLSTTQPLSVAGSVVLDPTSSVTAPAITMTPSATLQTSLGQTAVGTSTAGRLITPAATVAGTLAIRSTDTTVPGRSLVVEAARVTGTFDTIDPDARTAGALVDLTDAGLEIRLATVAPPPTTTSTTTTTSPPTTTTTTTPPPTTTTTTTTTTSPPTTTTTTPPPTTTTPTTTTTTTSTTTPATTTTSTTTTTTTTNPDPVPGVSGQLGELLDRLYAELPRWAEAVDPTDLPVFAGDLAAALGLDELAQLEPPDLIDDAADDLAAVATALEDAGCSIDWVAGVPGQPTPPADGDLIQARCEQTVEPEPTPLFDGDDLLDGLATDVTVTADGEFETAVALRTVVGIDATGPYVLGETGVEAQLGGTVTVTGTAEAADGPTVLTGTVDPDLTTTLTPGDDAERRLRPDELSTVSVTPAIDGAIDTTIVFATGPLVLDWNGSWTVATTDGPIGSTVDVSAGTQDVSGSFVSDIGAVEVNGVRDPGGTWTIDSEASTEPSALDGFVLERLAVSAVITPTSISGSGSLDVRVDVAGPDGSIRPFDVATEVSFDDDGIDVTGRQCARRLAIGEPTVVWLQRIAARRRRPCRLRTRERVDRRHARREIRRHAPARWATRPDRDLPDRSASTRRGHRGRRIARDRGLRRRALVRRQLRPDGGHRHGFGRRRGRPRPGGSGGGPSSEWCGGGHHRLGHGHPARRRGTLVDDQRDLVRLDDGVVRLHQCERGDHHRRPIARPAGRAAVPRPGHGGVRGSGQLGERVDRRGGQLRLRAVRGTAVHPGHRPRRSSGHPRQPTGGELLPVLDRHRGRRDPAGRHRRHHPRFRGPADQRPDRGRRGAAPRRDRRRRPDQHRRRVDLDHGGPRRRRGRGGSVARRNDHPDGDRRPHRAGRRPRR